MYFNKEKCTQRCCAHDPSLFMFWCTGNLILKQPESSCWSQLSGFHILVIIKAGVSCNLIYFVAHEASFSSAETIWNKELSLKAFGADKSDLNANTAQLSHRNATLTKPYVSVRLMFFTLSCFRSSCYLTSYDYVIISSQMHVRDNTPLLMRHIETKHQWWRNYSKTVLK